MVALDRAAAAAAAAGALRDYPSLEAALATLPVAVRDGAREALAAQGASGGPCQLGRVAPSNEWCLRFADGTVATFGVVPPPTTGSPRCASTSRPRTARSRSSGASRRRYAAAAA
jgi:hypothetical protein